MHEPRCCVEAHLFQLHQSQGLCLNMVQNTDWVKKSRFCEWSGFGSSRDGQAWVRPKCTETSCVLTLLYATLSERARERERGHSQWPCQPDFHHHQGWITWYNSWNTPLAHSSHSGGLTQAELLNIFVKIQWSVNERSSQLDWSMKTTRAPWVIDCNQKQLGHFS